MSPASITCSLARVTFRITRPCMVFILIGHELRAYRQTGRVTEETRMQLAREPAPQGRHHDARRGE